MIEMFDRNFKTPVTAIFDAGYMGTALMAIWLIYPIAVVSLFHPTDIPNTLSHFTGRPLTAEDNNNAMILGWVVAALLVAVLSGGKFILLLFIYRHADRVFVTWPLAAVVMAACSVAWWFHNHDAIGELFGLAPFFAMFVVERIIEMRSRDLLGGKVAIRAMPPRKKTRADEVERVARYMGMSDD